MRSSPRCARRDQGRYPTRANGWAASRRRTTCAPDFSAFKPDQRRDDSDFRPGFERCEQPPKGILVKRGVVVHQQHVAAAIEECGLYADVVGFAETMVAFELDDSAIWMFGGEQLDG